MMNIFVLQDYGLIKISGPDAGKLLQGQLTCNIEKVTIEKGLFAAHCNPQGRIISLFRLSQFNNDYYLVLPRNMISLAISSLKKYAIFYKTELTDASNDFTLIGCKGSLDTFLNENPYLAKINIAVDRNIMIYEGSLRIKSSEPNTLSWKYLDIMQGIPSIYPETTGKFLPHEINLHELGAIDFEKGCYTGQEIIARMHYRGKLKNHLYKARIGRQSCIPPGTDIYTSDEREKRVSGMVVDACHEAYNQYITLILTNESNIKNTSLFLDENDQDVFTIL